MMKKRKILLISIGIIIILMAAAYGATAVYFMTHFYSGTTINGIDCTHLGVEEVKAKAEETVKKYQLNITTLEGSTEILNAAQLQLAFVDDGRISQILKKQNPWLWAGEVFQNKSHDLDGTIHIPEEALSAAVSGLACMQEGNITPPQDAVVGDTDTDYTVVPEVQGNQPDGTKVAEVLKSAVLSGETEVNLAEKDCYVKPSVYRDDEALNNRVNHLNQLVSANLTIDFGSGRTETVNAPLIKTWVTQNDQGEDVIDQGQVETYVSGLAEKYNTVGITRSFKKTGGGTVKLKGGDYGWVMNVETTASELAIAVLHGEQGSFEVTYTNSAKSREANDIGNSYVEISITQQTMWCYVDGKLLVTTPIVTGSVANKTETPKGGVWKVKGKQTDYTMTGKTNPETGKPSYTAHCNYWIPYSEDLTIGLHDLVTRSAYGGEIYLTNGSHGCVNTPLEAVKKIYDVVAYGFPVVVY